MTLMIALQSMHSILIEKIIVNGVAEWQRRLGGPPSVSKSRRIDINPKCNATAKGKITTIVF